LPVLAGFVAVAVGAEAEVLGDELLRCIAQLGTEVAALIADAPFDRIGFG